MSACFSGECCTYRGDSNKIECLAKLALRDDVILVCPEQLGGLPTPRSPAEIVSESPLTVINSDGEDVTQAYINGAKEALKKAEGAHIAILKHNSPSCGVGSVYDGTFSHITVPHDGVFARMVREKGILLFTETSIDAFFEAIGLGK